MHPPHDGEPLRIPLTHGWSERFLGNDLRQDQVVARSSLLHANRVECRHIACNSVATASQIGLHALVEVFESKRPVGHPCGLEPTGEIELARRVGADADGLAVEVFRRFCAERCHHHEALSIVVVHARERQAARAVSGAGPGRVADEDVDLARPQLRKSIGCCRCNVSHLAGVAEDSDGDRLAVVDIKAGPTASVVRRAEAGEVTVHTAAQCTAVPDRIQGPVPRLARHHGANRSDDCTRSQKRPPFHPRRHPYVVGPDGGAPGRRRPSANASGAQGPKKIRVFPDLRPCKLVAERCYLWLPRGMVYYGLRE